MRILQVREDLGCDNEPPSCSNCHQKGQECLCEEALVLCAYHASSSLQCSYTTSSCRAVGPQLLTAIDSFAALLRQQSALSSILSSRVLPTQSGLPALLCSDHLVNAPASIPPPERVVAHATHKGNTYFAPPSAGLSTILQWDIFPRLIPPSICLNP